MRPPRNSAGLLSLAVALGLVGVDAFYIPGWSIRAYTDSEPIPLLVNKVSSAHTPLLPHPYFDLPFVCPPTGRSLPGSSLLSGQSIPLNLGEVLRGDRIRISDMDLRMGNDAPCRPLCRRELDASAIRYARRMVREGYVAEWILDNLPAATSFVSVDKSRKYYAPGFKLGYMEPVAGEKDRADAGPGGRTKTAYRYFLYNHHTIVVRHRKAPGKKGDEGGRVIVGFEVYPKSIAEHAAVPRGEDGCPAGLHTVDQPGLELLLSSSSSSPSSSPNMSTVPAQKKHSFFDDDIDPDDEDDDVDDDNATLSIPYTYSVYFREDQSIEWAHRWDRYFLNQEDGGAKIHWLAVTNSLIICGLLSAVVIVILARTSATGSDSTTSTKPALSSSWSSSAASAGDPEKLLPPDLASPSAFVSSPSPSSIFFPASASDTDPDDHSASSPLFAPSPSGLHPADGLFLPPPHAHLLAPLIGSGTQLLAMTLSLILLAALGLLNPSYRGGFLSFAVALFVAAGLVSGYVSAGVENLLLTSSTAQDGGPRPHRTNNTLVTATLVPGLLFAAVLILNLFVWAQASSTALPFATLLAILALWLGVQVPLVYLGAWAWAFGNRRRRAAADASAAGGEKKMSTVWSKKRRLRRVMIGKRSGVGAGGGSGPGTLLSRLLGPGTGASFGGAACAVPWYARSGLRALLVAGLIPFLVILVELLCVFQAVWRDTSGYYYVFGFLAVVVALLVMVVAEVSVVAVYVRLSFGGDADSHPNGKNAQGNTSWWWWYSFGVGAASALWVAAACVWYYVARLHIVGWVGGLLFFGYSGLVCAAYALLTGTVGFLAAYAFMKRINGAVKVD